MKNRILGAFVANRAKTRVISVMATLAGFGLVLGLSGCGGTSAERQDPRAQIEARPQPYAGELLPLIESFERGPGFSSCDQDRLEDMKDIAAALDARAADINRFTQQAPRAYTHYVARKVGPITIQERDPAAPAPIIQPGWQKDHYSWWQIRTSYQDLKRFSTLAGWSNLNAQVRSILSDDRYRILFGLGFAIGHDNQELVFKVQNALRECAERVDCVSPALTAEGRAWLLEQNLYGARLREIESATLERHMLVRKLAQDLDWELKRFAFRKNQTVRREDSRIIVPLIAGPFETDRAILAQWIESAWKGPKLRVQVEWVNPAATRSTPAALTDVYELLAGRIFGGRSYVDHVDRQLVLYDGSRVQTVNHEVGHVLGFPDHYYTVWNPTDCAYESAYRDDDLMSDSALSQVTAEEWAELEKQYPASP